MFTENWSTCISKGGNEVNECFGKKFKICLCKCHDMSPRLIIRTALDCGEVHRITLSSLKLAEGNCLGKKGADFGTQLQARSNAVQGGAWGCVARGSQTRKKLKTFS